MLNNPFRFRCNLGTSMFLVTTKRIDKNADITFSYKVNFQVKSFRPALYVAEYIKKIFEKTDHWPQTIICNPFAARCQRFTGCKDLGIMKEISFFVN